MLIYLIGPSGVGKSSCARLAARSLPVEHVNLDELCRGRQFDWGFCHQVLARIERDFSPKDVLGIADIGAGIQCSPELQQYLSNRRDRVLLIFAPAPEVIARNPLGPDRSLAEYLAREYSSRAGLYAIARHRLDIAKLSEPEAQRRFIDYIRSNFELRPDSIVAHTRPSPSS